MLLRKELATSMCTDVAAQLAPRASPWLQLSGRPAFAQQGDCRGRPSPQQGGCSDPLLARPGHAQRPHCPTPPRPVTPRSRQDGRGVPLACGVRHRTDRFGGGGVCGHCRAGQQVRAAPVARCPGAACAWAPLPAGDSDVSVVAAGAPAGPAAQPHQPCVLTGQPLPLHLCTATCSGDSRDDRRRDSGGGAFYGGGPRFYINLTDLLWYWDPW